MSSSLETVNNLQDSLRIFIDEPNALHYQAFSDALGELACVEDNALEAVKDAIDQILKKTFSKDLSQWALNLKAYSGDIKKYLTEVL